MEKIEDESIDLIVTDPPYNLGNFMRNRQTNIKGMRNNYFCDAGWDDLTFKEWIKKMDLFFEKANKVLKKKGALIIFMSLMKTESIIKLAEKHGFYYKTTGIWHKQNPMPRNMNLHFINSVEGWLYFINKGKTGTFNNQNKAIHDFIETTVTNGKEKNHTNHPTQKPEYLYEFFINILSNKGDTILDPFMGSGTCGVACRKKGRNFIGIEINKDYYDDAYKRILENRSLVYEINITKSKSKKEKEILC
jgi:DNA modification methylase